MSSRRTVTAEQGASRAAWDRPTRISIRGARATFSSSRRPVAATKEDRPPVKVPGESEGKMSVFRFSKMIPPSAAPAPSTCHLHC